MKKHLFWTGAVLLLLIQTPAANAALSNLHITDGQFDPGEWTGPGALTVSSAQFAPAGPAGVNGNSVLYVDQGASAQRTLWLMYDWIGSNNPALQPQNPPASFFDVFFNVGDDSYLVRIHSGINNFQAWEKPDDVLAPIVNGSFDPANSPWTPVTSADLLLGQFHTALGPPAPSPNSSLPHLQAEFDLTINGADPAFPGFGDHAGLYSPAPEFWSASAKNGSPVDPPISSAIFTLHPDGTTTVVPILGPNGPVFQPPGIPTPEPVTAGLSLLGLGVLALGGASRRRRA